MQSYAAVPIFIAKQDKQILANTLAVLGGVVLISLLAQVAIPLPWTPVPITGQTFAVSFVALLWGWKRGASVLAVYLLLGWVGMPVFALGKAGLTLGPTIGYLFGMLASAAVVGYLADRGFTKTFFRSLLATYIGSAIIFSCGVFGLSFFLPTEALLAAGVLPFLIGDTIKNFLAATASYQLRKQLT